MYYWSPTMGDQAQIDAGEIANLVAAFEHLRREDYVDPEDSGGAASSGEGLGQGAAVDAPSHGQDGDEEGRRPRVLRAPGFVSSLRMNQAQALNGVKRRR